VRPDPEPRGLPVVHAWGAYAGPLRPAVTAWKDEGRGDLARVLGPLLAAAVEAALGAARWEAGAVLLVAAPSSRRSRRQRGEVPLERLLGEVVAGLGERGLPVLRALPGALAPRRRVADQAGLGTLGRAANLRGALVVGGRWEAVVKGRRCLVVDDVMTSGATIVECSRALDAAGAAGVVAATIGATQRRAAGPAGALL
jgi:predicted amidophosphoribosyltransferase